MKKILRAVFIAGTTLILCEALAKEPRNIDLAKQEAIKYHDSGEYDKDIENIIIKARLHLEERIKKSTDARKLALILDIDDTVLSTYGYKKGEQEKYWECYNCNCVIRKARF